MGYCYLVVLLFVTMPIVVWLILELKDFSRDMNTIKEFKTRGFQDAVDSMSQEEREELLRAMDEMSEKRAVIEKRIREDKARRGRHCESPAQSHSNTNLHTQAEASDYRPSPSRSSDSYSDSSDSSSSSSSYSGSSSSD